MFFGLVLLTGHVYLCPSKTAIRHLAAPGVYKSQSHRPFSDLAKARPRLPESLFSANFLFALFPLYSLCACRPQYQTTPMSEPLRDLTARWASRHCWGSQIIPFPDSQSQGERPPVLIFPWQASRTISNSVRQAKPVYLILYCESGAYVFLRSPPGYLQRQLRLRFVTRKDPFPLGYRYFVWPLSGLSSSSPPFPHP